LPPQQQPISRCACAAASALHCETSTTADDDVDDDAAAADDGRRVDAKALLVDCGRRDDVNIARMIANSQSIRTVRRLFTQRSRCVLSLEARAASTAASHDSEYVALSTSADVN